MATEQGKVDQKIEALSDRETLQLQKQRSWVRDHYDPGAKDRYETLEGKLALLETILRNNWVERNETWKLQSLGVSFGDALVQELNLRWIAVEDEYGRDPALHDQGTTILLFPVTSISKRIEKGETVDVRSLFRSACEGVVRARAQSPSNGP
ncbi:hypothetical protein SSBR45G_58070 [Bradyrhizobium sp. SSBR45G]|uniref:DUF3806 domain-containing protein n=1 Tax=unclassified Bradyrhizobium TaxID=2631580 RepID=UPI002342A5E6|nr:MULTISPECIES: DUF3806 domain-containing protein [unclassified Bradyrhizobium]GLH80898.1 hypothetical protein SSBR45G_58070 [Bradyrhizobium sp. SSBR45G]GLH88370.1 hypothetical protein SSBR45R_58310 [Bradyrhizobium sp. SSBR45R]